jgi:outer membrane immunogenic protein
VGRVLGGVDFAKLLSLYFYLNPKGGIMKKTSLAALLACAAISSTAVAQTSWTGPYVGAFGGMTTTTVDTTDYWCEWACDAPGSRQSKVSTGVAAGHNWQLDKNFVVGVELDYSTGTSSSEKIRYLDYGNLERGVNWNEKLNSLMTLRAKAGLVLDKTMLFVTAGPAIADMKYSAQETTDTELPVYAKFSGKVNGYAAGAGIEHKFDKNLSLKAEYLHVTLSAKSDCWKDSEGCIRLEGSNDDYVEWTPTINTFRIGLNYAF